MKYIKDNILLLIFLILSLIIAFGVVYARLDLTSDKRYTLTDITKKILGQVQEPIEIEIFLDGDFPANFKQLQSETISLLDEFNRINSNITYKVIDPIKEGMSADSLQAIGLYPSVLSVEEKGVSKQIKMYPYATVTYKKRGRIVPLIVNQQGISTEEQLNKSIEGLEYGLIDAIDKLIQKHSKSVGILVNQSELNRLEMFSFASRIIQNYNFAPIFPRDKKSLNLNDLPTMDKFDAIIIAKPRKAFTDEEKLAIDQYIMHGGKTLWLLDQVNAEMDTLLRSNKILAYPYDLNLTDLLFSYGVRINPAVIKDIRNPAYINLQVGEIQGNAQNEKVPWVYFPLGLSLGNSPITRNLNPVRFEFPSPIDTLATPGIKKTILYQTSYNTAIQATPSYISLEEAKLSPEDNVNLSMYNRGSQIMAVLLEGKFNSAYSGRVESSEVKKFIKQSPTNKMIIVSDGDVARNQIIKGEPLPLGLDYSIGRTYGNEEFLMNSLEYLLDNKDLMNLRNRTIQLRLLNKQEVVMDRSYWQWLNLLAPIIGICLSAFIILFWRRKKFNS